MLYIRLQPRSNMAVGPRLLPSSASASLLLALLVLLVRMVLQVWLLRASCGGSCAASSCWHLQQLATLHSSKQCSAGSSMRRCMGLAAYLACCSSSTLALDTM
jgi:hypothetical protein